MGRGISGWKDEGEEGGEGVTGGSSMWEGGDGVTGGSSMRRGDEGPTTGSDNSAQQGLVQNPDAGLGTSIEASALAAASASALSCKNKSNKIIKLLIHRQCCIII